MKKFLPLFLSLLLVGYIAPAFANSGDSDSIDPPILRSGGVNVVIFSTSGSIEVQFFNGGEATIEVIAEDGVTMYQAAGMVAKGNQLSISTSEWNEGVYTIAVWLNGWQVQQKSVPIN